MCVTVAKKKTKFSGLPWEKLPMSIHVTCILYVKCTVGKINKYYTLFC